MNRPPDAAIMNSISKHEWTNENALTIITLRMTIDILLLLFLNHPFNFWLSRAMEKGHRGLERFSSVQMTRRNERVDMMLSVVCFHQQAASSGNNVTSLLAAHSKKLSSKHRRWAAVMGKADYDAVYWKNEGEQ